MRRLCILVAAILFIAMGANAASGVGPPSRSQPSAVASESGSPDPKECATLTGALLGDPPPATPFEATTADTALVAEQLDNSFEEQMQIEQLQWRMSEMHLAYVDPGFAAFGSNAELPFEGWYATSSQDTSRPEAIIKEAGLSDFVKIRQVPFSDCELQVAVARAAPTLADWPHGGEADALNGVIVYAAADPDRPLPSVEVMNLVEKEVSPIPVDWHGGKALVFEQEAVGGHDWGDGTAGFVVSKSDGDSGISTVAHVNTTGQYQGVSVQAQSSDMIGGSLDENWYDDATDAEAWGGSFWNGTLKVDVNAKINRADMAYHQTVCHYGAATGNHCGRIYSTAQMGPVPNSNSTWVGVEPLPGCGSNCNLSEGGDSGGPWWWGNTAYGLHEGGSGNNSIFMAQNYLSALNVSVKIHS